MTAVAVFVVLLVAVAWFVRRPLRFEDRPSGARVRVVEARTIRPWVKR